MKPASAHVHKNLKPALTAALVILCGIALWGLPRFENWRMCSYDSLFRFGTRQVTNRFAAATGGVAIIFMDNWSYEKTGQSRSNVWSRARHAALLDKLAADGCPLVVFDVYFGTPGEPNATRALVESMERLSNVVLMARQSNRLDRPVATRPGVYMTEPQLPLEIVLDAARGNWGIGFANGNTNFIDQVVRKHWRFPSPGIFYDSLAWKSAEAAGAPLSDAPEERWIRYYEPEQAWTSLSYVDAEVQPDGYFRDKWVFIGNKPMDNSLAVEIDKFTTPLSWSETGHRVGGVEILATEFLNLVNHEWLRRPPAWFEIVILVSNGALLGLGSHYFRIRALFPLALAASLLAFVSGVCLSYFTNYWFPWLIVAGAQVPLAFGLAVWHQRGSVAAFVTARYRKLRDRHTTTIVLPFPESDQLETPDYKRVEPPFGKGAYGQVWIARNAVGQWQAVKAIYRKHFGEDDSPYEREFKGIERYKPVSDKHPGLLRVDFVSMMKPQGYFYYVMELGDAVTPGWEQNPASYTPLDLAALCSIRNGRLTVAECVRIGTKICEALEFLHSQGLAHRDIKPRNIIFVKGQPKLADVGLVADARRPEQEITLVGTPGFMPPEPEPPGTMAADIYGLGMVLYVISTGSKPAKFPELSETMVDPIQNPDFGPLMTVIFKACQPDRPQRYGSATDMIAALRQVDELLHQKQVPT
jgi:CHASE2 domain-containing sensor protein